MNWIPVAVRVPDTRREVLTWGCVAFGPPEMALSSFRFLGVSRCNVSPTGHRFDNERRWPVAWLIFRPVTVTHWAEITTPYEEKQDGSA